MKTDFKFSNLLGTVYGQGNLVLAPDGNSLLSPVGNRVSVFDLTKNTSFTLPFSHRRNISQIDLTPDGNLLLSVDEDGRAILTILPRRISIYHFSFKSPVTALAFSPTGDHFVVGLGRKIQAWQTPSTPGANIDGELHFAPFVLHREYGGHHDEVTNLSWSGDSRFFVSASKDLTARIWSLDPEEGFEPTVLSGHRETVRSAWFSASQESIYTVSRDGALFRWEYVGRPPENGDGDQEMEPVDERWRIVQREYFMQPNAKLKCACFHSKSNLLTVCFNNGLFSIYELPSFSSIHTLSIASSPISAVSINGSGEWLAFGSSKTGQLLVWEYKSESHILKQSSHLDTLTTLSYSPDSSRIITGADDGQIKIWDLASGFHIATFTQHTSAVTSSTYSRRGNVLFTCSLDGSVRAWDMLRYRNFRTFTAPTRISFSCLAIDPAGEIVCAASTDDPQIYVWNVQTGQLLDQLSGHEGPISTLSFTPDGSSLASGSWDHTIRLWNIFARTPTSEPLPLTSDIHCLAISPDSQSLCCSTLDGSLTFFNLTTAASTSTVSGSRDISGGRTLTSRRTASSSPGTKSFTTLTYSADGTCLLAGGNSKYVCLYSTTTLTLIKKFTISINLSLDGTQEFLNSSAIMSNGLPRDMLDADSASASDLDDRIDRSLPGARRGIKDATSRTQKHPEVRCTSLQFAPTGRSFCAATTEGLLIYSLDHTASELDFDPIDLDLSITPQSIIALLAAPEPDHLKALLMAFRLGIPAFLRRVYESVPYTSIPLLIHALPHSYLARLLRWIGDEMSGGRSPHLEFHLRWLSETLAVHGRWIKEHCGDFAAELRGVMKGVEGSARAVRGLSERNRFEVGFLVGQAHEGTGTDAWRAETGEFKALLTNGASDKENEEVVIGEGDEDGEEGWIGLD